jgi:hypothetical protein
MLVGLGWHLGWVFSRASDHLTLPLVTPSEAKLKMYTHPPFTPVLDDSGSTQQAARFFNLFDYASFIILAAPRLFGMALLSLWAFSTMKRLCGNVAGNAQILRAL